MPEFSDIFLQKKSIAQLVRGRPAFSESLTAFVISVFITLIGMTLGFFFENIVFLFFGSKTILEVFFASGWDFVVRVFFIIPGLIGFVLLVFVYFVFGSIFGSKSGNFSQFLSDYLIVAASVGVFVGLLSLVPFVRHLLALLVVLYGFFLYIVLVKEFFSISFLRALIAWLLPTVFLALFFGITVIGLFGVSMFFSA